MLFEKKFGVRPGDKYKDRNFVWVVSAEDTHVPGMVDIWRRDRGPDHEKMVMVSDLLGPMYRKVTGRNA